MASFMAVQNFRIVERRDKRKFKFLRRRANDIGTRPNPPKKEPSEARARRKGGCRGNSASPEPKRSPATLLVKSRPPKKNFVFLLEEKIGLAQIKNCEQNFSLSKRAKRAAAGRSESLVVLFKKCSNFVQKTPPQFV